MEQEYKGRTAKFVRNGHTYYAMFAKSDIGKNIYGDKRSDFKGQRAKIKVGAEGNVFELVENAKYNGSRPESGKNIAAHKGVTYWDYFIKTVQIDNTVFDLVANVRKRTDGPFVYSIQLNENKNVEAAPLPDSHEVALNRMPTASGSDSVNQNDSSVNSEYMQNQQNDSERTQLGNPDNLSLAEYEALYKDTIKGQLVKDKYVMNAAESIEYNELMQENSALQEAVATLQNELKASGNDVRLEDVKKAVKGLVKEYGGDMKLVDEYAVQVSTVFNYIANTENIGNQDVFQYIHKVAESIIKNSSSVDDTLQIENADILDTLKSTKIQVSEAVKNGMGKELYNGLRRSHMKTLKLLNNEGMPVDSFYRELNELYPWAFPDTVVNASEQLQTIADFVDSCEPRVVNPYAKDGTLTAATDQLALDIYEKYFEVRSAKETFADKAVKKQNKMKAEYAQKIAQAKEQTRKAEQKKQEKIKERYEDRLSKLDSKRREQLDKLAAEHREKTAAERLRRRESKARNELLRRAKRLNQMKKKTSGEVRAMIDELIGNLDLNAMSMTDKTRTNLEEL